MIELPIADPMVQFTVLVAIALVTQLLFERLHLPGLLGLLVIGLLLGPGGFHVLPREPLVALLGTIGLIYVMFLAGVEIDLDILRRHPRETATFGVLGFLCSFTPTVGVALLLGYSPLAAILLGALLSSHTLVAYPVVARLGLLHQRPVVAAIGGTLITDTLALVTLVIVVQLAAFRAGGDGGALGSVLPIVLLAAITVVSLLAIPWVSRRLFASERVTRAEKALFVLFVVLGLAALAELIGTKDILGAFLAGLCLNRGLGEKPELREHVDFVGRMLFIPFFFVATGMLLEFEILTGAGEVWLVTGILLFMVFAGKATAAWLTGQRFGYSWRGRLLMTGLTVPQAAATLAITLTGRELGLFAVEVVDAVILLIFTTCVVGPVVTQRVGRELSDREEHVAPRIKSGELP